MKVISNAFNTVAHNGEKPLDSTDMLLKSMTDILILGELAVPAFSILNNKNMPKAMSENRDKFEFLFREKLVRPVLVGDADNCRDYAVKINEDIALGPARNIEYVLFFPSFQSLG